MAKKNNGKVVQLKPARQSAENYIKTQARSLPIAECLITDDWEDTGICNIIVARQHKNGNLTVGIYLVDLYCLGLKDTLYEFNLDPEEFEYLKENSGGTQNCDYVLAHNIIYGAIAFAEDYGFKPHKNFAVAQNILEEDDDAIELMELEFGFEGEPFYVMGPNDDEAKVKQIRNTLMRTAGEGNFTVIDEEEEDDWFDDDDELDEYENDEEDDLEEEIAESIKLLKAINKIYDKAIRTAAGKERIKKSTIGKGYKLTEDPVMNGYNSFDNTEQEGLYRQLFELFDNDELEEAIEGLKEAIIKYPGKAQFYNLLQGCYLYSEQTAELNAAVDDMYRLFPDFIFSKVAYAQKLIGNSGPEKALEVFNGATDLNYLYPGQKLFNIHEAAIYYAVMCLYFTAVDDIDSADLYMNVIIKKDLAYLLNQTIVSKAMYEISKAKMDKIKDKGFL